jgi:hypothetical protein
MVAGDFFPAGDRGKEKGVISVYGRDSVHDQANQRPFE